MNYLEIQKYGGSSMASAEAVMQSASVVANSLQPGKATLVVVSAMEGMTEWLRDNIYSTIANGYKGSVFLSNSLRHHDLIEKVVDPSRQLGIHKVVDDYNKEAEGYIEAMARLGSLSPRHYDWICARLGEGLMAPIFTARLQSCGVDAKYDNAAEVIVTDGEFGNANPLIGSIRDKIKANLFSDLNKGRVVVMDGYYGADRDGNITTFSRGGSDLTATVMGHALVPFFDSIGVYLYKADVAGVMSADPKIVQNPHVIPHMLYEEAAALTAMGGKVIHPRAVNHAVRSGRSGRTPFPILVKSTIEPDLPGTLIDNRELPGDNPIKAISLIKNAVRLTVEGWGMDRPGIMNNITRALAQRGIDIDFISQPHSKLALDLAFQFEGEEAELKEAIRDVLNERIKANDIDAVDVKRVGVIGVIGKSLSDPRILGRVIAGMNGDFPELRRPNAYKLTTGKFEASILVDLPEERLKELVISIYNSVFDYR